MKKIIFTFLLVSIVACDDGDLAIETVDFDSITTVQSCDDVSATESNLLFKINGEEALILTLPALAIQNVEGTTEFDVTSSGTTVITYRIFSDNVTTAYFCSGIPPTEPTVLSEVIAESGTVSITTTLEDDMLTYTHVITLNEISLVTSDNSRITDQSINVFGEVTTEGEIEEETEE